MRSVELRFVAFLRAIDNRPYIGGYYFREYFFIMFCADCNVDIQHSENNHNLTVGCVFFSAVHSFLSHKLSENMDISF